MSKPVKVMVTLLAACAIALPAMAATFEFHGDLNNRFNLATNHAQLYSGGAWLERGVADTKQIDGDSSNATWGEIKYRLWTEAATNNSKVKGVYAVEIGGLRFGQQNKAGTSFSGDGINIETRWAYTALQLPNSDDAFVKIGLQPYKLNSFLWNETAMGIVYKQSLANSNIELGWIRGVEYFNDDPGEDQDSLDALSGRWNFKPFAGTDFGLFALLQHSNPGGGAPGAVDAGKYEVKKLGAVDLDIYTIGIDGSLKSGNFFANWDAMYQTGSIDNADFLGLNGSASGDFDLSAYLLHGDIGINIGATKVTFTSWYASGDDNEDDNDFNAFMATDVDRADSVVFFEGGYADDSNGTERPYILDKGMFLNKIAVDHKVNDAVKVGAAALYVMTAEDIEYIDDNGNKQANNDLGFEFDAYVSYKIYDNVELALNGGYLVSGDAMDAFEYNRDGKGEENIYRVTSRLRYQF